MINEKFKKGREQNSKGEVYEGEFWDGKKQGYGKYCWADKSVYEGNFHNNALHGIGLLIFKINFVFYVFFFKKLIQKKLLL